jgi:hypothetical protein
VRRGVSTPEFRHNRTDREKGPRMSGFGRTLVYLGLILVALGLLFSLGGKIPWLGNLPGDIYIQRGRFTFYFPLATCVVVSVIVTLVLYLFRR